MNILPKTMSSSNEATMRIKKFHHPFIHVQLHEVKDNKTNKKYSILQWQYWTHGDNINVTRVAIKDITSDEAILLCDELPVLTETLHDEIAEKFTILSVQS